MSVQQNIPTPEELVLEEASPPTSFAVEVGTVSCQDGVWTGNGCRYATRKEAETWGSDRYIVWTAMTRWQVVHSDDEVNT